MAHIDLEFLQQQVPVFFIFFLNVFYQNGFPRGTADLYNTSFDTQFA
jgi:hypothetical protein